MFVEVPHETGLHEWARSRSHQGTGSAADLTPRWEVGGLAGKTSDLKGFRPEKKGPTPPPGDSPPSPRFLRGEGGGLGEIRRGVVPLLDGRSTTPTVCGHGAGNEPDL